MAKHSAPPKRKKRSKRGLFIAVFGVLALLIAAAIAIIVVRPPFAEGILIKLGVPPVSNLFGQSNSTQRQSSASSDQPVSSDAFSNVGDIAPTQAELEAEKKAWKEAHQTPLMAQCSGIDLRCAIAPASITGILFHQASYGYALPLYTEIAEADYERVADSRIMRINPNQQTGAWLDAEALHVWRTQDDTPMDTSIDMGALAGTVVYAPVDGTVVLVRDYMLYDEMPDVEIHIQPDGRPDLDCVLIHTTNPTVKAGDRVEAGITEISQVRDIEAALDDVQLAFFVPEGVGGNHVHVQVNDANSEGYREKKLEGALKV